MVYRINITYFDSYVIELTYPPPKPQKKKKEKPRARAMHPPKQKMANEKWIMFLVNVLYIVYSIR